MGRDGLNVEKRADSLSEALENADYAHERLFRVQQYIIRRNLTGGTRGKLHYLRLGTLLVVGAVWIAPLPLAATSDVINTSIYRNLGAFMIAAQLLVSLIFLIKLDWLRTSRWGATWRFTPAIGWGIFVGLNPELVAKSVGASSKTGAYGGLIVCVVTILAALIWLAPIRPPHQKISRFSKANPGPDWSGLDEAVLGYDRTLRSNRAERRINARAAFTFTVLTAIVLNLFSLIGSLAHPLFFLTAIAIACWLLWVGWKTAVDQRQRAGLQFNGALGAQLAFILICVAGLITFVLGIAVDVLEYESWVDRMKIHGNEVDEFDPRKAIDNGFNREDWILFLVQVVVLVLATGVPIWASRIYADKTAVSLRRETVIYSVRGKRIFEINQATCVVKSCRETRFLWPRTLWLPVTVVRSGEDSVLVNVKWRARGFRKNSRYVYRYSEVQHGDDLSIIGANCKMTYRLAKARSFFSGRSLIPWDQSLSLIHI